MATTVHVIPVKDSKEHWETPECWCEPRVAWGGKYSGTLVNHRGEDERETGVIDDDDPKRGPFKVVT